jgi:hypothetical protein
MKNIFGSLFILLFASKVLAAGYGAAGCGLGSIVFEGKNEWYEQVMAATTNGIASQTFAITFGSLNCDANKLAAKSEKAKVFIAANKNSVLNELSQGQGETLNVLAKIYNCPSVNEFSSTLKTNYSEVVISDSLSTEELVQNINKTLTKNNICQDTLI